jgi:hypothetical protein
MIPGCSELTINVVWVLSLGFNLLELEIASACLLVETDPGAESLLGHC